MYGWPNYEDLLSNFAHDTAGRSFSRSSPQPAREHRKTLSTIYSIMAYVKTAVEISLYRFGGAADEWALTMPVTSSFQDFLY